MILEVTVVCEQKGQDLTGPEVSSILVSSDSAVNIHGYIKYAKMKHSSCVLKNGKV